MLKILSGEPSVNLERQFLIKWAGWSHLHNTWESEASLQAVNAKGMKKIDNYMKRLREVEEWYVFRLNELTIFFSYFICNCLLLITLYYFITVFNFDFPLNLAGFFIFFHFFSCITVDFH